MFTRDVLFNAGTPASEEDLTKCVPVQALDDGLVENTGSVLVRIDPESLLKGVTVVVGQVQIFVTDNEGNNV